MNTTIFFILCAALAVLCRASEAPPLPTNVYLDRRKALLEWDSDSDDVTYTVQYCTGEDGQCINLPGCVKTQEKRCEFSAIATDLSGATLWVRSERNDATSTWQQADRKVGCIHAGSCYPEVVVNASPGYLSLQMDCDQSLKYDYGGHLTYTVFYGREGESMKVFRDYCASAVRVEPLSAGVRYCVKVRMRLYSDPFGNMSKPVCQLIPHSEWERDVYLAGMLAGVFALLVALSVGCYCFIKRYHKDIKDYIRPVTLPEDLKEFPSDKSVQQIMATPYESHDLISGIEVWPPQEQEEEEGKGGSRSMPRSVQDDAAAVEEAPEMEEHRDDEGSNYNSSTPLI